MINIETSLPHLNHSLRQSLWLHFHWHELILEMEKPFLLVLDLRNSKNTLKNTWKTIQLKSEWIRVESSRCHTRSLHYRHRASSYFVASLRVLANEARGRRRARFTGDGGRCGKNNKYLCKCKFRLAKSNQSVENSVNFNDPSLSNHWVTFVFDTTAFSVTNW